MYKYEKLITPATAGSSISHKPQTCFNRIARGVFFLPLYDIDGRKMCKQSDLDSYFANLKPIQTTPATPAKRKVGRPTKAQQIAAIAKSGVSE
jgi:hypothetical protein